MFKRSFALATFAMLLSGSHAFADAIVHSGTIQTNNSGGNLTDINQFTGGASSGNQFINNTTSNTFGAPGTTVSVGANLLSDFNARTGATTAFTYNGNPVVAVFAVQGSINGATGVPVPFTFTATKGTVGLFSITSGFNQFNPLTWGATSADGKTLLTPIATWDLVPPQSISDPGAAPPGGGGPGLFDKVKVNEQAINTVNSQATQGFFLFKEGQNPNYWNVTNNLPLVPPGFVITGEGLIVRADDAYRVGDSVNTDFIDKSDVASTAGFNALNTIATSLGGIVGGFATDFGGLGNSGGPASDYNPSSGAANALNTNDTIFSLGSTSSPVVFSTPIPEPASLLLWAGVSMVSGLVYRRNRRNNKKAASMV